MRRVVASLVLFGASLALLASTASARAQASSFRGGVNLSIKGWGTVKPGHGFDVHLSVPCANATCAGEALFARVPHVVLIAKPSEGWKFLKWRGPCRAKTRPKCVINLRDVHVNTFGERVGRVRAMFMPVAPGLTRANPIPVGTASSIVPIGTLKRGGGFTVRVNSATPEVQLSQAAPSGDQYFDANLTVTYSGGGSATAGALDYDVMGSQSTTYNPHLNGCPDPGPQPPLDLTVPIHSGQFTSGYVCWTIAANDASSLELYFGSGTLDYPGTMWFALH